MNNRTIMLIFSLQLLTAQIGFSQPSGGNDRPFKGNESRSGFFAADIIIDNKPAIDQKNIRICSAFNGDLFAVYSYFMDQKDWIKLLKSDDKGLTWEILHDGSAPQHNGVMDLDLLAAGNSLSDLRLFLAYCIYDTSLNEHVVAVISLDTIGTFIDDLLGDNRHCKNISIATDYSFPAINSSPYSIAALYSIHNFTDRLIFKSSSNGGWTMGPSQEIASTSGSIDKVSLSYGRSPSQNSGRYFSVWGEKENADSPYGHIYTSHSDPEFNSPFTDPVLLDTGVFANKVRNPSIACQFNSANNDSSEFTEVIVCERYDSVNDRSDLIGFYNKKAVSSNTFTPFTPAQGNTIKKQPSVCFNPFDSTFILTYFDSTEQKLPYLVNNFNFTMPDSWNVISEGYNDVPDLISPKPLVKLNQGTQKGMNVWTSNPAGGNGVALFDAPDHYYTGIPGNIADKHSIASQAFPNPSTDQVTIEFTLPKKESVVIGFFSSAGQSIKTTEDIDFPEGTHWIKVDLHDFPGGIYLYRLKAGEFDSMGKILLSK